MPSFCPKLESSIKVMHCRMAKNDTKFTKVCFSRDLSLKSGKINFHEFWTIFDYSGPHHLKKTPKKSQKWHHEKKNFWTKNEKTQNFFLRWAINHPKIIKKSKFLCSITSHAPKTTEKIFMVIGTIFMKWNPDSWKKNIPEEMQVRLQSLPIAFFYVIAQVAAKFFIS